MDIVSYGFAFIVLSGGIMGYMKAGKELRVNVLVGSIWSSCFFREHDVTG